MEVEEEVKELAIDIAEATHPFRVSKSNHEDAPWRQWVPLAKKLKARGWRK